MKTANTEQFVAKRGRPSAKQVAAIEHTILTTARHLFLKDGYEMVAMETIASEAGVSKGTLYSRHASKESLFEAVVQSCVEDWSSEARREDYLLTDDLATRLRHHARTIARSLVNPEQPAFQRLLLANGDKFPSLAKAMYKHGYLYIVDILRRDLEAAAIRDHMPVHDADGIARHLVSAMTGWFLQESADRVISLDEIQTFGNRIVHLLLVSRPAW